MILKCWKNVLYLIGSLNLKFFILNGEILTKTIQDFSIPEKKILCLRFKVQDLSFSISPMPARDRTHNILFSS